MPQSLICNKKYIETIFGCYILIDSTFLVDLSKDDDDELTKFLDFLRHNNCTLVTILEVFQEFARGAKSVSQYNKYIELFNELEIKLLSNSKHTPGIERFVIAYNNFAKKASLTDLQLALRLYKYSDDVNLKLLTANYNDMPTNLLRRESIIAYDMHGEIRTHGFYALQNSAILNGTLKKVDV